MRSIRPEQVAAIPADLVNRSRLFLWPARDRPGCRRRPRPPRPPAAWLARQEGPIPGAMGWQEYLSPRARESRAGPRHRAVRTRQFVRLQQSGGRYAGLSARCSALGVPVTIGRPPIPCSFPGANPRTKWRFDRRSPRGAFPVIAKRPPWPQAGRRRVPGIPSGPGQGAVRWAKLPAAGRGSQLAVDAEGSGIKPFGA